MMPTPPTTGPACMLFIAVVGACAALNVLALGGPAAEQPHDAEQRFPWFLVLSALLGPLPVAKSITPDRAACASSRRYTPVSSSFYPFFYAADFLLRRPRGCAGSPTVRRDRLDACRAHGACSGGARAFPAPAVPCCALLASPAALLTAATGETAFFTTALLLAGFGASAETARAGRHRLRPTHAEATAGTPLSPSSAGARASGGRSPPPALRHWRAGGALLRPAARPELWRLWVHIPAADTRRGYFSPAGANLNMMVTPAANLRRLGASPAASAIAVQTICGLGAAGAVVTWLHAGRRIGWRWRRC